MDNIRVLFVKPGDKIKDVMWAIHHYADVLSRNRQFEVYFATSNFQFPHSPDIQLFQTYPPLKRHLFIFLSIVKRWIGFAKILKKIKPDILFVNNHMGAVDCLVPAVLMQKKISKILDIRTLPDKKWKYAYYNCITPFFDFVFGLNEAILSKMVNNKNSGLLPLGFDPGVFFIFRGNSSESGNHGSDTTRLGQSIPDQTQMGQMQPVQIQPDQTRSGQSLSGEMRSGQNQPGQTGFTAQSQLHCIYFGSLDKKRRIIDLVKAVERAIKKGCLIRLTLIGSGNGEGQITSYINNRNLDSAITLHGFMPQKKLKQMISAQHLGISYVPNTGMYNPQVPLKTIEMLACGIPVLATRTQGNQTIVKQGQNGYITNDSVEDMADTLTDIWETGISSRMYQNSAESVKQMSWENIVANHLMPVLERVKNNS